MTYQLYSPPKDRTTRTGGSANILAWVSMAQPTYLQMITRLAELRETPRTEQSQFVLGQIAELQSALTVAEDEIWNALEASPMIATISVYRDDIYGGWLATYPTGHGEAHENTIGEMRALVEKWWGCTNWRRIEAGLYVADTEYRVEGQATA